MSACECKVIDPSLGFGRQRPEVASHPVPTLECDGDMVGGPVLQFYLL